MESLLNLYYIAVQDNLQIDHIVCLAESETIAAEIATTLTQHRIHITKLHITAKIARKVVIIDTHGYFTDFRGHLTLNQACNAPYRIFHTRKEKIENLL